LPGDKPSQDSVEVPDPPMILLDDRLQTRLVELVRKVRARVWLYPVTGATVIVEIPGTFVRTVIVFGLAETTTSWTVKIVRLVTVTVPLFAVMAVE